MVTGILTRLLLIVLFMSMYLEVFPASCKLTICAGIADVAILITWKWLLHLKTFGGGIMCRRRVIKIGVKNMLEEENILGVADWSENTDELEKQLESVKGKLHFSRTMVERQQVLELEKEVLAERERVKVLRALAYSTAVKNKPEIERLKLETAQLVNESIEIDNESVMLEQALKAKYQKLNELKRQIEDVKTFI
jgi:hypothetical protein